jgi:primosomal protein N' (replication factor Y)
MPASPGTAPFGPTLSQSQEAALDKIRGRIERGGFETFLLYGVTGSGKTEVYLRAMEEARRRGKRSLILIPEIALTPQLLDRLESRFPNRVGVLHSGLTPAERWRQWRRITDGNADVIAGARSAVFAPVADLGLIVVDEEHDPSYKQDDGLAYHARDLSVVRGKLAGCAVVLGSATPSLESFTNATERRYRLLELPHRVEERLMPIVEVVDLRQKESAPTEGAESSKSLGRTLFSARLRQALQENHARRHQSLLFLNRRGFANFLQCSLCGFVLRCPHCSVTTTFHLRQTKVTCHHCGFSQFAGDGCPSCEKPALGPVGFGTEQVESDLLRILPGARIARMDRDTTGKRGSQERMIRGWEKGEIDVLVGTQMITKGHDVGRVTLVGAILADLSLNVPDFRAAERTFQLLCQVAGRAGRGEEPGRVIVQTYNPDHYALQHLVTHDFRSFYDAELEFRKDLQYPPFSGLILIRLDGIDAKKVENGAKSLGEELRRLKEKTAAPREMEILGPAPAPIQKIRNRHRWQLLLKGKRGKPLLELAQAAREIVRTSRALRLHIDVDPYQML